MRRLKRFLIGCFLIFPYYHCQNPITPDKISPNTKIIPNHYAEYFQLRVTEEDTLLHILNLAKQPIASYTWGKSFHTQNVQKIILRERIATLSVLFARMVDALGQGSNIIAIDNKDYVPSNLRLPPNCVSLQTSGILNIERLLGLSPHISFLYVMNQEDIGTYQRLQNKDHSVIFIQSHQEKHPLARAEWLRAISWVLGEPQKGDSLFNKIKNQYENLRTLSAALRKHTPKTHVMMNLPFQGAWFVPNSEAYFSQLLQDAGFAPSWKFSPSQSSQASIRISMEEAIAAIKTATIWLHPGTVTSRKEIVFSDSRLSFVDTLKSLKFYQFDKQLEPHGANAFWDLGALHPELILEDLIKINQHSLDSLYFYRAL